MNKSKFIIPIATVLMLASCGVKTKEVTTIWGNTWGYTNTVFVGFEINDRQKILDNKDKIDWTTTEIIFDGNESIKYAINDQKVDNILSAEFIRESKYPGIVKQRDFFANNKIVVSSKEEKTVTIGKNKYDDAIESNGTERISFNKNVSYLMSACDTDGLIERLTIKHSLDGGNFINEFDIVVTFKNNAEIDPVRGSGFFEIAALA
ncbi:MAG: hypothetical protein MJ213_02790 [Bacilli bacterium]|nr:hypothetical protein [Bacilli bacterium]